MDETIYLSCAVLGGTLLVCQFLLGLIGFGDHHDAGTDHDVHDTGGDHDTQHEHGDHDAHATWFVGVLTFRSAVAALTLFGLAGLTARVNLHFDPLQAGVIALAAGAGTLFLVAYMMRSLHRLKADGTVRIERAVGHNGTVYLTIPAAKAGRGKVTLNLQNRTVEYQAVTPNQQLPTGAKVVVTAVIAPDTVEVVPASEPGV
jgi:membrane protein implicated in regulation of membrane protease activity